VLVLELLDAIKIATKAAEGLQAIRSRTESSDSRIQDMVSKVLRTIYFPPDGILGLLNEVAEGQKPTEKRLKQGLTDFNDRQWTIERSLERLEWKALENELGLGIHSIMALGGLRNGKWELRDAVQHEVNSYGQKGVKPNIPKVRALIAAIKELNTAIEQVELSINRRAFR
jgi:hypothetical protein